MSNRPERLEPIVFHLHDMRRPMVARLSADGEFCEQDRALVEMLSVAHEELSDALADRRLADYIDRGGDVNSAYGKRLASAAGKGIVSLEEVRRGPTVITFRPQNNDTAS